MIGGSGRCSRGWPKRKATRSISVTTGREGCDRARRNRYDILILDWMLPDMDGLAVCTELRRDGCTIPILMLTARAELSDRVLGLRSGADDYLVKPFEVEELLARVVALVRRSSHAMLRIGPMLIDRGARRVLVDEAPIELTSREYGLLAELASCVGEPVARLTLLSRVWGLAFDPGTNVVEVHVSRLREKLGKGAVYIETVRGVGYRLRRSPDE